MEYNRAGKDTEKFVKKRSNVMVQSSFGTMVSVLMMTYNQEKYVAQAIESVIAQEANFVYELVISDDSSTDKTQDIVKHYAEKNPDNIKLILQKRNLNRRHFLDVYGECRGKYVALCEGDDYWIETTKLQQQVEFLEKNPSLYTCFHDTLVIDEERSGTTRHFCAESQTPVITLEDMLEKNLMATSSVMFRNKFAERFPDWFSDLYMGDWPLHIWNAQYGPAGYLPKLMSVYRLHEKGISRDRIGILSSAILMLQLFDQHFQGRYSARIAEKIPYYTHQLAIENCRTGIRMLAKGNLTDAYNYIDNACGLGIEIGVFKKLRNGLRERLKGFDDLTDQLRILRDNALLYCNFCQGKNEEELTVLHPETIRNIFSTDSALEVISPNDRATIFLQLGTRLMKCNELSEAEHWLERGLGEKELPVEKQVRFRHKLGEVLHRSEKVLAAISTYSEALKSNFIDNKLRADIVLGLGDCYRELGQLRKEEDLYVSELSSNRLCGISRFGPLLRIGDILTSQKHFAAAEKRYDECLSIENLPFTKRIDVFIALSICYKRQAKYNQAQRVLLELSMSNGLSAQQVFHINLNLGYLYFQSNDYLKAKSFYESCLAFEAAPEVNLCDIVLSLGECYTHLGKAKHAEELYKNSLQRCYSTLLRFKILIRLADFYLIESKMHQFCQTITEAVELNGISHKELSSAKKLLRKAQEKKYQFRNADPGHARKR